MPERLHLAVALDRAPGDPVATGHWAELVGHAERGLLDFVTIEDRAGDPGRGLDALLIAARVAPLTSHIGLVPTVVTTTTEPFHVSTQVATLDFVSRGRAGWRARVALDTGRPFEEVFADAADHVEVVRRLWDSWEDGAEIRDVATGRFVDRDRLHFIDFTGAHFSVKGPSITPRPPQGQPIVAVLAHTRPVLEFAAAHADVVLVTPTGVDSARELAAEVRGRTDRPLKVFADFEFVAVPQDPTDLADLLTEWQAAGLDGFRLRPGPGPDGLPAIVDGLVPELQRRGLFRERYESLTLRGHLGLDRPASRYATTSAVTA